MAFCIPLDFACVAGSAAETMVGSALDQFASATLEALGVVYGALGTAWLMVPSPEVGAVKSNDPKVFKPIVTDQMLQMETLLGWLKWTGLVICVGSLLIALINMMFRARRGDPVLGGQRILVVCGGAALIGASSPIVGSLLTRRGLAASVINFLQANLWWLTIFAAVVGVVMAGIRLAWQHRVEPLRDWGQEFIGLAVWTLAGASIVSMATSALDSLAVSMTFSSLQCGEQEQATCFGENLAKSFGAATAFGTGGMFALLAVVLGGAALLGSLGQIALLLVRSAIVPVMLGVLPVTAAAATSGSDRAKKAKDQLVGWLVGFVLYKAVAAVIYSAGFFMAGTDWDAEDGTGILRALSGIVLLAIAVVALPMLMKAVAPPVGAVVGNSSGGALGAAALAALPLGIMGARALMGRGSGGGRGSPLGQLLGGRTGGKAGTPVGVPPTTGVGAAAGPIGMAATAAAGAGKKLGQMAQKAAAATQSAAGSSTGSPQPSGSGATPGGALPGGSSGQPTGASPGGTGGAAAGQSTASGSGGSPAAGVGGAAGAASKVAGPIAVAGTAAQAASGVAQAARGSASSAVQQSTGGGPTAAGAQPPASRKDQRNV